MLRIFVHKDLQVGCQVRGSLEFVKDGPAGELGQESTWIVHGERAHVGRFEVDIGFVGKQHATKCGFPTLPGAGNGNNWKVPCSLNEHVFHDAAYHDGSCHFIQLLEWL